MKKSLLSLALCLFLTLTWAQNKTAPQSPETTANVKSLLISKDYAFTPTVFYMKSRKVRQSVKAVAFLRVKANKARVKLPVEQSAHIEFSGDLLNYKLRNLSSNQFEVTFSVKNDRNVIDVRLVSIASDHFTMELTTNSNQEMVYIGQISKYSSK